MGDREKLAREVLVATLRALGDRAQLADGIAEGGDHALWASHATNAMLAFSDAERLAQSEASDGVAAAKETIRDALMDSQYMAGVTAGWNAAQADDPEAALASLRKSREGHLAGYAEAKVVLAAASPKPASDAGAGYAILRDQLYGLAEALDMSVEQEDHYRGRIRCYLAMHEAALSTTTDATDAVRVADGDVPVDLRVLSDRATPGPWAWEQCGEKEDVPVVGIAFPSDDPDCKTPYEGEFRDNDASRMTIAYDWQACDGNSPSANAAFAVASVNYVRAMLAASPTSPSRTEGGEADESTITDEQINDAIRHGFGERFAGPAIPAGMVPWHGGDSAPEDWDGGPVMRQRGDIFPPANGGNSPYWQHDGDPKDIVAYTPRAGDAK